VNFDPSVGSEIKKIRPAVVINDDALGKLPQRIVVPVTDWKPKYSNYPWFVHLMPTPQNGLGKESGADAFQVKSIDERRLISEAGEITNQEAERIAAAVALCVQYKP
jgi:mRNA interferase MazF